MEQLSFIEDQSPALLGDKKFCWQGFVSDGAAVWPGQSEEAEQRYSIDNLLTRYEGVMKTTKSLTDKVNSKPLPARLVAIAPCPFNDDIDEIVVVTNSVVRCRERSYFSSSGPPSSLVAVFQARYFRTLMLTGSPLEKDLRLNWSLNYFQHNPILGIWDQPFEAIIPTREHLRFMGMPIGGPRFDETEVDLCIEAVDEALGRTDW